MFTNAHSLQIANEIQADHRRRATTWRFARRRRRAEPGALLPTRPLVPATEVT